MKIRFFAGEMAQLHNISKQTILYYDRIGLLPPREKDPVTGYRYYSLEQSEDLDVILLLRDLGMSLKDIIAFRQQESSSDRITILESQSSVIEEKMKHLNKIQKYLDSMVGAYKSSMQVTPFEKGIRWINARSVIIEDVEHPYDLYSLELIFKKMFRSARERYESDMTDILVFVDDNQTGGPLFKRVALTVHEGGGEIVEEGYFAYIYHKGTFESLEDSRLDLYRYIQASGYKRTGLAIERVLLDSMVVPHEKDYLIEIQYPVESIR